MFPSTNRLDITGVTSNPRNRKATSHSSKDVIMPWVGAHGVAKGRCTYAQENYVDLHVLKQNS